MFTWPNKTILITYLWVALQLTIVFTVLYGFANWVASQRTDTYQLWMEWELAIPLWPWMIVVYMSLNILNILPLFTLSAIEIDRLGKTMIIVTIIAAPFFLLFPAHAGFSRTTDVGLWKPAFEMLYSLDRTANTFPSLHITYSFLIVRSVSQNNSKLMPILCLWFLLICSSVLLVHQHHVADIIGGLFLAEICYRRFFLTLI